MKTEILLFGQLTDIFKAATLVIDTPRDTDALHTALQQQFPQLENTPYTMAVDKKTVTGNIKLTPGSTVALLPPFSGG